MFWCSDIDWEFSHLSWSTSITSIVIRSSFVRSQDAASARQLQVSKTVRIATAGKHAMGKPWHVWSAQHQRCERAASSSVVNVLAPQSRVTVPVLYWQGDHAWLWHLTVAIPSTSIVIDIGRPDSSCETGTFSTGKFAKSKTCFLILFYLISELVLSRFLVILLYNPAYFLLNRVFY